jgi:hypothetical protein
MACSDNICSERTIRSLAALAEDIEVDVGLVATLVAHVHSQAPPGAILIFCAGWDDINKVSGVL